MFAMLDVPWMLDFRESSQDARASLVNLLSALNEFDRHQLAGEAVLHELGDAKVAAANVFDHLELRVVHVHLGRLGWFRRAGWVVDGSRRQLSQPWRPPQGVPAAS